MRRYNSLQDCEPARIDGGYVKRGSFIGFWKQKSHSSIGRFLYALHGNAKNSLLSQRGDPLETLQADATGREKKHNDNRKIGVIWDIFH